MGIVMDLDWDLEEIYFNLEEAYDDFFVRSGYTDALITDHDILIFRMGINLCRSVIYDIDQKRKDTR